MGRTAREIPCSFSVEVATHFRCCVCKEPRPILAAAVAQQVVDENGVVAYFVIVCRECQILAPTVGSGPADYVLSTKALEAERLTDRDV